MPLVWRGLRNAGAGGPVTVDLQPAPWAGATEYEVLGVDEKNEVARVTGGKAEGCKTTVELPTASVRLVRFTKGKAGR